MDIFSYLYQIAHLGDDDEEPEFSSAMPLEEGDTFLFQPRQLKNLVVVDEVDSLSPILHCQVRFHSMLLILPFFFTMLNVPSIIVKGQDQRWEKTADLLFVADFLATFFFLYISCLFKPKQTKITDFFLCHSHPCKMQMRPIYHPKAINTFRPQQTQTYRILVKTTKSIFWLYSPISVWIPVVTVYV